MPSIIVIFGITGDLAQRKLLPALYHLFKDDLLDPRTVILGITRRAVSVDELLNSVELCVNEIDKVCDPTALKKVHAALRMHQMSQTDPAEYRELHKLLNNLEKEKGVCMNRLYYLSIPPQMFEPIVRNLGQQGLNKSCQHGIAASRLLIEKPFGYNLTSARDLIAETGEWFNEKQLFRIDHYLAKDTVQNIIEFRALHDEVETIWNREHIDAIEITAYEKIDIEGRATFYEQVGALRDFIQSHLLQLLAVVTMDLPSSLDSAAVHATRLAALTAVTPVNGQDVAASALRAQYKGYRGEVGVADSNTETFARIKLHIDNKRWLGVPVTLQTGKAMSEKRTDVRLRLKNSGAELVFHIQPDTGISLEQAESAPEIDKRLHESIKSSNVLHPPAPTAHPDAYERVLLDAVRGDHTLFTTSDEVIAAWKVIDNVLDTWSKDNNDLLFYPKGSKDIT